MAVAAAAAGGGGPSAPPPPPPKVWELHDSMLTVYAQIYQQTLDVCQVRERNIFKTAHFIKKTNVVVLFRPTVSFKRSSCAGATL